MSRDERRPLPPRLDPRAGRGASEHGAQARGSVRAAVAVRSVAAVLSALLLAGSGWG